MPRPHRRTRFDIELRREIDGLNTKICCLRHQFENREGTVGRLELLLRERLTRIDNLTAQVDQLRQQNHKLDAECEHLVEIVRSEG